MPALKSAMPNGYNVQNPPSRIPTYLPLAEAAHRHGLSEKVLTQLIQTGKIGAVQLSSGEVLVAADNNNGQGYKTKEEIITHKYAFLRGQVITPYAAQKKYEIHRNNFIKWARAGYINIFTEEDRLIELDEADVAYCAYIYQQKKREYGGSLAGVTIFDEHGDPYQIKYKEVAEQMRIERRQAKEEVIA